MEATDIAATTQKMSIRLKYYTKHMIGIIAEANRAKLQECIDSGYIDEIRDKLSSDFSIDGVRFSLGARVSTSRVIEDAFLKTRHYSKEDWSEVNSKLDATCEYIDKTKYLGSLTPILSLEPSVESMIEEYKESFEYPKQIRTSSVIQYVVHAYYLEFFDDQD